MLRSAIMAASRNRGIERVVSGAPISRSVVRRFVGGADTSAAIGTASSLVAQGLLVTLDHLGEDTTDVAKADAVVTAYLRLLEALHQAGLTEMSGPRTARADLSVKLSALGQALPDGEPIALDHARQICAAARRVGATVTLDAEDHTTTDSTLTILGQLREDFPETAAVVQAYLRRTEGDCRDLAKDGVRVRLCKGAYHEPASVAFPTAIDVDRSYVRCINILLAGQGYPMFATHDPRLIDIAAVRAQHHGVGSADFEFQMLYGVRPDEQRRLAKAGHLMRVYIPYGNEWYSYLMRRLAERPANLSFFLRALVSKG